MAQAQFLINCLLYASFAFLRLGFSAEEHVSDMLSAAVAALVEAAPQLLAAIAAFPESLSAADPVPVAVAACVAAA